MSGCRLACPTPCTRLCPCRTDHLQQADSLGHTSTAVGKGTISCPPWGYKAPFCSRTRASWHGKPLPQGCWHSQGPGARGSRDECRTAGRAQSSSPPRLSHPRSPAGRCTPGMHSGRTPAHRGTRDSGREQAGLQGHVGKAALSLVHQLLLLIWGRFSCSQRLRRAHCSHIQSCASSLASGYINPKATGPYRKNSYSGPGATTDAGNRQPAYGALHLSTDTYPSPSVLGTHQPPLGETEGIKSGCCSQPALSLPSVQSVCPSQRQTSGMHSWPREQPHCRSPHSPSSQGQPCKAEGEKGYQPSWA